MSGILSHFIFLESPCIAQADFEQNITLSQGTRHNVIPGKYSGKDDT